MPLHPRADVPYILPPQLRDAVLAFLEPKEGMPGEYFARDRAAAQVTQLTYVFAQATQRCRIVLTATPTPRRSPSLRPRLPGRARSRAAPGGLDRHGHRRRAREQRRGERRRGGERRRQRSGRAGGGGGRVGQLQLQKGGGRESRAAALSEAHSYWCTGRSGHMTAGPSSCFEAAASEARPGRTTAADNSPLRSPRTAGDAL